MAKRTGLTTLAALLFLAAVSPTWAQVAPAGQRPRANDPQTHLDKADSLFKAGQYKEAVDAYKEGIRLNPNVALPYYQLGWACLKAHLLAEAVEAFKQSVKLDPNHMKSYHGLGHAYHELQRYEDSADVLKQAIRVKADDFWSHVYLGRLYFFNLERYEEASEAFREAARIDPNSDEANMSLGVAYNKVGQHEDAITAFTRVVRLRPQEPTVFLHRSYAYLFSARGEPAAADAQKYLSLTRGQTKQSPYLILVAHFGYRQAGRDADAGRILEEAATKKMISGWPHPVVRYLRKEINARELLAQATDGDQKTQAQTYIGMDLTLAGRADEGLIYLEWVRDNGNKKLTEYGLALAQLRRVKNSRKLGQHCVMSTGFLEISKAPSVGRARQPYA